MARPCPAVATAGRGEEAATVLLLGVGVGEGLDVASEFSSSNGSPFRRPRLNRPGLLKAQLGRWGLADESYLAINCILGVC